MSEVWTEDHRQLLYWLFANSYRLGIGKRLYEVGSDGFISNLWGNECVLETYGDKGHFLHYPAPVTLTQILPTGFTQSGEIIEDVVIVASHGSTPQPSTLNTAPSLREFVRKATLDDLEASFQARMHGGPPLRYDTVWAVECPEGFTAVHRYASTSQDPATQPAKPG